ncbi:MAG: response regulator transcription factor [Rhodospirillaceae bacterium]
MRVSGSIYVVEDEPEIGSMVRQALEEHGYRVRVFSMGLDAIKALRRDGVPDLCVIDLGLPDVDGMEVVRILGDHPRTGVIILTGRRDAADRVLGLETGADDYISKPFEPRELVARINAFFRRRDRLTSNAATSRVAHFAGWIFDPSSLSLKRDPSALSDQDPHSVDDLEELGAAEAGLLLAFLKAPKRILSRDALLASVGRESDPVFDRSIDVRVSRLRKKIEPDPKAPKLIRTVYGAGYVLTTKVVWVDSDGVMAGTDDGGAAM